MPQELKKMIFMTIEDHLSLKDFESWLYRQEDLSSQMSDNFILALFAFNYNQKGAKYEFKSTFLEYFEKEEFMLWKVKTNLQDLIEEKKSSDRILNEFYQLGYDELPFLHSLGYYMYELEDSEYRSIEKQSIIENLKKDASELLQEILSEEIRNPEFRISEFKRVPPLELSSEIINADSTQWWKFWK